MNFDKLIKKLRKENALDWKTAAIDELSEKIYESDKLNLVCELIQNANDSYANKVCFVVKSNEINLYHNGNPFNENDITKITRWFLNQISEIALNYKQLVNTSIYENNLKDIIITYVKRNNSIY